MFTFNAAEECGAAEHCGLKTRQLAYLRLMPLDYR